MGLDIMFYKVKPRKGTNVNSPDELYDDLEKQSKRRFSSAINKQVKKLKQAIADNNTDLRIEAITGLYDYVKSVYPDYSWHWKGLTIDKSNKEILKIAKLLKKTFFPQEDVYFRKANFVYRFFEPYLVDEECIVTKDMVTDLLERCDEVISAAKEENVINENGEIDEKYHYCKDYWNLSDDEQKLEIDRVNAAQAAMPRDWNSVAADLLPTRSGFFFGSTDYGIYYLEDILSCKKQFTKLLANWKDNEVVFNHMSW